MAVFLTTVTVPVLAILIDSMLVKAISTIAASSMAAIRSGSLTRGHKVGSTRMMFKLSTPMVGITCSTPSIPGFASRSTSFNHFSSADSGEIAGCSSLKCEAHPAKVLTVVRQLFPIEQSSSSRICNIGWIGRVTNVTAVGKIKKYKRSSWQMGCWTDQISL